MGFFDFLYKQDQVPVVQSILPDKAKQEIINGRLPKIDVKNVFLKKGEICFYADRAILMKQKIQKNYNHIGWSAPGLFKGTRIGAGTSVPNEHIVTEQVKGYLYITNQRVIFQAKNNGFDKAHKNLSTITPYSNGVELQYGNNSFCIIVEDGNLVNHVMKML